MTTETSISRHQRRGFQKVVRRSADKIRREEIWENRFGCFAGACRAMIAFAAELGLDGPMIAREFGGELARRIIVDLGAPPIGDVWQAVVYRGSSDPAHRDASLDWQREHQPEMRVFARDYPEAFDDTFGPVTGLGHTVH